MAIQRATSPIQVYRGDAYTWQYQLNDVDENGIQSPINISTYEISGQVRYTPNSPSIWFTIPIQKTDPANGVFEWRLTESESQALLPPDTTNPSSAVYDIQLRVPNPDPNLVEVITFLTGTFVVITDVTRL